MKTTKLLSVILGLSLICALQAGAAEEKDSKKQEEARKAHVEHHEQMAKAHQEAANCLKDGKPMSECRQKMMESCRSSGMNPRACMGMARMEAMGLRTKHGMHGSKMDSAGISGESTDSESDKTYDSQSNAESR